VRYIGSNLAKGLVNVGGIVIGFGGVDLGDPQKGLMGVPESVTSSFESLVFCKWKAWRIQRLSLVHCGHRHTASSRDNMDVGAHLQAAR
jgi:hypothetical protein